MHNNKNSYAQNIIEVKNQAAQIEHQVKQTEKLIKIAGGASKVPEQSNILSKLKIDAIKAKLAILEGLSKEGIKV